MQEDLTQSPHVGVRWQAQMEDHLKRVRESTRAVIGPEEHLQAAQANAVAALTLAIAGGLSDLQHELSLLVDKLGNGEV